MPPTLLPLDDLVEIAQLSDAQLDASDMAFIYFPGARNGRAIRVRERETCDDYQVLYQR